jgi:signal transduction histidine kinase
MVLPMRMDSIRAYLLPGDAERDSGFRQEMHEIAHLGLRVVGLLEAAVPLVMLAAGIGVIPIRTTDLRALMPNLLVAGIGALTIAASLMPFSHRHSRLLTALSVWLTSATLELAVFWLRPDLAWVDHYLLGNITLVQFGAATLPFRPMQTFALGICIDAFYLVASTYAQQIGRLDQGFGFGQHMFTFVITCACTGVTAIVYRQRSSNYEMHQRALRASEDLRRTQAKLLITENAAVMGRLAAALSHELNSPIGVLTSAVDTLSSAAAKNGPASDAERERVQRVVSETRRAGIESADRLRTVVARMQRFTNLDRAEVQAVQLNDLIADVIALLEPDSVGKANIEFHPASLLPRFTARPQQLSAVFANLIGNAVAASNGGHVRIETAAAPVNSPSQIEVTIHDSGRGMTEEELRDAFNPASFRVSGQRIAAGNWSLFSCRQIVQEHGGDVEISSVAGQGTTVKVTLPL